MRKRLINICAILILAFSIYGCGQTAEVTSAIVTETVEPQDTEAESEEVSNEAEPDNTVAEEEQEQDEDETDLMSNITAEDMFFYKINDNGAVVTGLREKYKNYLQENMPMDNEIEIPDTLFGYSVVEIGDNVFEDIKLKSVHIPESVEIIGSSAFRNTGIEDVNLSECYNLKEVKAGAFENCNLYDVDYHIWFMEKIGERAFAGNEQLTRVNFWSGDVIIEKDAFDGCGDEMLFYVVWSKEETGKEVEAYAAANGIKMEYSVTTQINVPSEPLLLTPEIGSFFYGMLGGTYDDWEDDMFCSFEKTQDAPNFGFEDWHSPGCSKWCHINDSANQVTASSELASASDRYCADNTVYQNREFAWAEGAEGAGIGEYIIYDRIVFSGSLIESSGNRILRTGGYGEDGYIDYTQICIVNGYARDEKVWQENGRVKTLMMYVYDKPYARLELEDTINPQYFTLPQGDIRVANGSEVTFKFVIEDVYPGTMYEDTCITGIVVDFGNVPDWH
ncbi:MAG: leucine-rich repeat domain-containing protein [Lachnospiraceae bacterium]|nr:leucine-rich repeat domain-containing protein [Lachnospiraceae bacterium]